MTEIIPAIMPKSLEDLKEKVSLVEGLVSFVQVDVMDGKFVESISWPVGSAGDLEKMAKGEIKLNEGVETDYEVDLMVSDPENYILPWSEAGAKRLIFHIEGIEDAETFLDNLKRDGLEIGLALNIDTPNEDIYPFVSKVDFIQFMGISKIGFQGEKFDERVLDKIKDLRQNYPNVIISVDGGVNLETASGLVEAGVNRLASGSAIFRSGNIPEAIKKLENF